MDWNKASAELTKPLDPKHVKGRSQGGGQVQYIEGWHAIAEMNRVFGFGEWSRETVELRQIGEPREVNGKIRVDYMARVRVTVSGVTRDGCGFGQGIDKDVGQAHESGLKEAETDAMKRAMMTFGNPFGLALYDKTRANVGTPEPSADELHAKRRDWIKATMGKAKVQGDLKRFRDRADVGAAWDSLPEPMRLELDAAYNDQWKRLPEDPALQGTAA